MLALALPITQLTFIGIVMGVLGLLLIGLSFFVDAGRSLVEAVLPRLTRPVVTWVAPVETIPLSAHDDGEATGPVVAVVRAITWPKLVDPGAGELDEAERKHVIEGLGIVGDAWCASVLTKAFEEEENEVRVAAIESLGQCDGDIVAPTLERAYTSYVIAERYAAIDGASRRGDVALLERAMRDTDGTVALAAAYGLHRAGRDDLIDDSLAGRDDARANEIRRVLTILA